MQIKNTPCPCYSRVKYKNCCEKYHKGAFAPNALTLMRSRYSAYALKKSGYIIKTTHPDNLDFTQETKDWSHSIEHFCGNMTFDNLKIVAFEDGKLEAFVTFIATLSGVSYFEKSRFLKEGKVWLYVEGELKKS